MPRSRSKPRGKAVPIVARIESARRVFRSDAALAKAIGVNRSQIRRWRDGRTEPSRENLDRLIGLEAVVELLWGYLQPSTIPKWLEGFNADLSNARPIYFLRRGELAEVIGAVEALKSGSFA